MSDGNYFSIDDILATQSRVPCKFLLQVMNLGFLDPSSGSANIQSGTRLELPFWLARGLCSKNRHIVSVEMPGIYKASYRDILRADAKVVDLHKHGPFFYDFGVHLLEFPHPDINEVGPIIITTFKDRFRSIMDLSQNTINEDVSKITARMDQLERSLFRIGQRSQADFHSWQICQSSRLQISTMVMNHKKRKRHTLEDDDQS